MTKNLIVNASPRKRGSASDYFLNLLKMASGTFHEKTLPLWRRSDNEAILEAMTTADVLVLGVPLYYDSVPSHALPFLEAAEKKITENNLKLTFYVLSNLGFIEGIQNRTNFEIYRCFCNRAKIQWGGALSLGGGVMLHTLFYATMVSVIFYLADEMITLFSGGDAFTFRSSQSILSTLLTMLFLNSGMIYGIGKLAAAIRQKRIMGNFYTRVMVPSFLFVFIASAFMAIFGLIWGQAPWNLLKKDPEVPQEFYRSADRQSFLDAESGG